MIVWYNVWLVRSSDNVDESFIRVSIIWVVNNFFVLFFNRGCIFIKKKNLLLIVYVREYIKYKIKWNNKCYRIYKILVY